VRFGVDEEALVLYGRWWQLETWLREVAYLELRSKYGVKWTDQVKAASGRQNSDAEWTHMLGPDNDNPLAYLDFSQLRSLMGFRLEPVRASDAATSILEWTSRRAFAHQTPSRAYTSPPSR
jgi:hypothetical protein